MFTQQPAAQLGIQSGELATSLLAACHKPAEYLAWHLQASEHRYADRAMSMDVPLVATTRVPGMVSIDPAGSAVLDQVLQRQSLHGGVDALNFAGPAFLSQP